MTQILDLLSGWVGLVVVAAGVIASWAVNKSETQRLGELTEDMNARIHELEKKDAAAQETRKQMFAMQEETRQDVKKILTQMATLAGTVAERKNKDES